jgi:hypothetical protein
MKINPFLSLLLIIVNMVISGCGDNKELNNDIANIADASCKVMNVMQKLMSADPADSAAIAALQLEEKQCQEEIQTKNLAFREKYKSQLNDIKFKKEFNIKFRKAILNCPYLSKEDREMYEKEID